MAWAFRCVSIISLIGLFTAASAQLPPEIRADAYLLQVEQAIRDGDLARARTVIQNIRILQEQHDLDLQDEFHFRYAKAAGSIDMPEQALQSIVKYLAAAGRQGQHYVEALELMNKAQAASSRVNVSAQLSPNIMADAYLLQVEQAIRDGDLDHSRAVIQDILNLQEQHELDLPDAFHFRYAKAAAAADLPEQALESVVKYLTVSGREGQYYGDALELMNRAQIGVSCRGWDTEEYFKTASLEEVTACLDTGLGLAAKDVGGVTPLHRAAKNTEKPEVIEILINTGADKEARDSDKRTPLHWAVRYNNPTAIKVLIEVGADPDARDKHNRRPLHLAALSSKNPDVVKALIDGGADLEARDEDNDNTPLHYAAKYNADPDVFRALVDAGADLEAKAEYGRTPLHYAVEERHPQAIEMLLKAGADRTRVKEKWTTLHWAVAYNEDPDAIKALLSSGADVNARAGSNLRPLHVAAKFNKNPAVIEILLKARADLKAKDYDKQTPLHLAARFNENAAVVEVLLNAGSNQNKKNYLKQTPLHLAAGFNENAAVVEVLLKAGAHVNAKEHSKWTPLYMAVRFSENAAVVEVLLKAGADPNARIFEGSTPLHEDIKNPFVARSLVDAGADPNTRNYKGYTPLHRAARYSPDVVKVLIDAGANPNARNNEGFTPLDLAAEHNKNPAVTRVLMDAGAVRTNTAMGPKPEPAKTDPEPKKGTDWGKVAIGVLGGAAIIHAGKEAPKEVVDQALTDWVNVLSDKEPTTNAPVTSGASPSQTQGAPAQGQMQQALQNLESVCGEKYRSGFADNDHYRFYCMAAFNDYCALKRTQNEEARTKLRASLTQNCGVLKSIGAASKCSYCQ